MAVGDGRALREVKPRLQKPPATAELLGWIAALKHAFAGQPVEQKLKETLASLNTDRRQLAAVPALGCLIKMREDLERIVGR